MRVWIFELGRRLNIGASEQRSPCVRVSLFACMAQEMFTVIFDSLFIRNAGLIGAAARPTATASNIPMINCQTNSNGILTTRPRESSTFSHFSATFRPLGRRGKGKPMGLFAVRARPRKSSRCRASWHEHGQRKQREGRGTQQIPPLNCWLRLLPCRYGNVPDDQR